MQDIEHLLKENYRAINTAIEKYVPKQYDKKSLEFTLGKARFAYSIDAANKAIAEPVWSLLNRGGKRWRPVLFMLTCDALGGSSRKFLDFVAIVECVHNGTLMVDDIEDDSDLRRGKPAVHKLFGTDVAINAGNALYYIPLLTLLKNTTLDDRTKLRAYEIYTQEMINISFGQATDIAWHKNLVDAERITVDEYVQMCAYKTGTLARMAARLGALFAGATPVVQERMGVLAESIGVAFQIQDDILNLTATSGKNQFTNEYVGSDITEGKRTLMVIHTLQKANKNDKKRLVELLNMHTRDHDLIEEAIALLEKYDSFLFSRAFARSLVEKAWNNAKKDISASDHKKKLEAFARFAVERDY